MKLTRNLILLIAPLYLFSCRLTQRLPNYIENVKADTSWQAQQKSPQLRIQKNDLLSIQIYSLSTHKEADELYNLPVSTSVASSGSTQLTGYLVDMDGDIVHHRLGTIHAEGLTKQELAAEIKKRLTEPVVLLADPTVTIRLINFKVTVLGEVSSPGSINVPGERINILEVLGLAGDFTQYGRKNTVRVSREINGVREIGFIDLSTKDLYNSPYYNLMQNDIIFVEPTKEKARSLEQQVVTQRLTFALSLITAAAFIYTIFQ
jgi:polysaccharide biosynthesis/export protein